LGKTWPPKFIFSSIPKIEEREECKDTAREITSLAWYISRVAPFWKVTFVLLNFASLRPFKINDDEVVVDVNTGGEEGEGEGDFMDEIELAKTAIEMVVEDLKEGGTLYEDIVMMLE
jgi:hypothetical protein